MLHEVSFVDRVTLSLVFLRLFLRALRSVVWVPTICVGDTCRINLEVKVTD